MTQTTIPLTQKEKAGLFQKLHTNGKILVLPNIWDPLGAAMLERVGYPAIATASASIAYTHGYPDGENIPLEEMLEVLGKIVKSVNIPVTADIESGYSREPGQFRENMERIIATGIVGINLEDSDPKLATLLPVEQQCDRIRTVREIADKLDVSLYINARTDAYIKMGDATAEEKLSEAIMRGKAFMAAGASGIFPVVVKDKEHIAQLVQELGAPINIVGIAGVPDLAVLREIGVARLSLGPGFLKHALQSMKDLAESLLNYEGFEAIEQNRITPDFLKSLVS